MRKRRLKTPPPDSGDAFVTVNTALFLKSTILNHLRYREMDQNVILFLKSIGLGSLNELSLSATELALLSENRILLTILMLGDIKCDYIYHSKYDCEMLYRDYRDLETGRIYENSGLYSPCEQDVFQFSITVLKAIGMKCCDTCQGLNFQPMEGF